MIQLSQSAIQEILRLRSKHSSASAKLRISTAPSGCLNLSYRLAFDDSLQPEDEEVYPFERGNLQVIVSSTDLLYLDGLVIDYSEDMMGGGFRFHNPKAVQVCGCGNSFAI
uniref:Iron-sulfur cluster assembly accessory protein n=1 Tax=Oscillatoriales cyanobacterium SpSt-402 TaxID=2282168 RepID=A0A832M5A1_9CYAN